MRHCSNFQWIFFFWEGEYGDRGPLAVSVQACMFSRASHDIPEGLSQSVSEPQVEEVNAAATSAAVVLGGPA